ncbi:hypothetical protein TNCV_4933411 [Trichonephila clavipes]|nr:hypothetical protein TNCV_4933411 [Trichonephila clavipes]
MRIGHKRLTIWKTTSSGRVIADIRPQMLEKVIENWSTSRLDNIRRVTYEPARLDYIRQDLELEVNENDIEELIKGHKDELTIELQEILNEEHQETQRNASPSEQEED